MSIAQLSDWLFTSVVGIYMLAALLSAAEYALERYPARRQAAVLVAAGSDTPPPPALSPVDGPARRCGNLATALTVLGALLHLTSLLLRAIAAERVPWANMYEYLSTVGLAVVLAWLYLLHRHTATIRRLTVFVLLPTALLLFVAGNYLYTEAATLQPALRSYWIAIHVAAAIMASGVFLVSGITSALHLFATRTPSTTDSSTVERSRLPQPEFLDSVAYRAGVFGFVTLTFAIITGAIWAESAWGRYWGWDPKETVAFVSWLCYAAYLHARSTAGWRARRATLINIAGLIIVLFNLFFINLVTAGLHSYTGLD